MLKILEQSQGMPIDVGMLKSCCGIPAKEKCYDKQLLTAVRHATACVEKYTRRTILTKTYEYTHNNNIIYLPKPIIQEVMCVSVFGNVLNKSEYKLYRVLETTVVLLDDKYSGMDITVQYKAGYGDTADCVPVVLNRIIFDCARFLFEYPGKFEALYAYYSGELMVGKTRSADMIGVEDNADTCVMSGGINIANIGAESVSVSARANEAKSSKDKQKSMRKLYLSSCDFDALARL